MPEHGGRWVTGPCQPCGHPRDIHGAVWLLAAISLRRWQPARCLCPHLVLLRRPRRCGGALPSSQPGGPSGPHSPRGTWLLPLLWGWRLTPLSRALASSTLTLVCCHNTSSELRVPGSLSQPGIPSIRCPTPPRDNPPQPQPGTCLPSPPRSSPPNTQQSPAGPAHCSHSPYASFPEVLTSSLCGEGKTP